MVGEIQTISKLNLSPSRIGTYLNCGEQFRRRYICNEIIPPGVALIRGGSVHKGAEVNHKQKIKSQIDLPLSQILEVIDAEFENTKNKRGFTLTKEERTVGVKKTLGDAKDLAINLGSLYGKKVAPKIMPKLVEEKITIELPLVNLICILDLANLEDEIIELKTGSRKNQNWIDTDIQLSFQGMAFRALTKKDPKSIRAEVLVDNKTPVVQSLISNRTLEDYNMLINLINTVINGINKEVFIPANSSNWLCSERFCGYWRTCPYSIKKGG